MKVTLSLPDYLVSDLKEIARINGITQSNLVATALYDKVNLMKHGVTAKGSKNAEAEIKAIAYKKVPKSRGRKG